MFYRSVQAYHVLGIQALLDTEFLLCSGSMGGYKGGGGHFGLPVTTQKSPWDPLYKTIHPPRLCLEGHDYGERKK